MNEHEQAFVKEFISPQRRDRYIGFFSSTKRRSKFRNRIAHALLRDLDARYLFEEDKLVLTTANAVRHLLQSKQRNTRCYVMCEDTALDGQEMTLEEAERQWDSLCGIIISIVPGKLVYYRPERPSENFILLKEATHDRQTNARTGHP